MLLLALVVPLADSVPLTYIRTLSPVKFVYAVTFKAGMPGYLDNDFMAWGFLIAAILGFVIIL